MATLAVHFVQGSPDKNGFTTTPVDTTGVDLLVLCGNADNATYTISDSKGNSWSTSPSSSSQFSITTAIFYVIAPTVGTGHTFTLTGTNGNYAVGVLGWSGMDQSSPLDQSSAGSAGFASTLQPGSITPGQANEVLVCTVVEGSTDTFSIDSSFTIADQIPQSNGAHHGMAVAYQIQTTATTRNPTWTTASANMFGSSLASFKASSGISGALAATVEALTSAISGSETFPGSMSVTVPRPTSAATANPPTGNTFQLRRAIGSSSLRS